MPASWRPLVRLAAPCYPGCDDRDRYCSAKHAPAHCSSLHLTLEHWVTPRTFRCLQEQAADVHRGARIIDAELHLLHLHARAEL